MKLKIGMVFDLNMLRYIVLSKRGKNWKVLYHLSGTDCGDEGPKGISEIDDSFMDYWYKDKEFKLLYD